MRVSVLGPVGVELHGAPVDLAAPKQRALVALLALWRGRPAPVDTIVDALWPHDAPADAAGSLQAYVSRLRRVLEPGRAPRERPTVLVTAEPGYALRVADGGLDVDVFEETVARVHRRLRPGRPPWTTLGEAPAVARGLRQDLDGALDTWRGVPFVELGDLPAAVADRARLEELRLLALEDRASLALELGEHATVAAELESLTRQHPLREHLWVLRALALARAGRQADALDVLRQLRAVLDTELGIDPGAEVVELQALVLRQDAALTAPPPPRAGGADLPVTGWPEPRSELSREATGPTGSPTDDAVAPWPLLEREADLAALAGTLDRAAGARLALACLVGEPGIGKTRLSAELASVAERRGWLVVSARCSQDEGAPPLRPWRQVLAGLGQPFPASDGDDEGAAFRMWDGIVAGVLAAAREREVLVVLDDLQWADAPSLRALRLLVESEARHPVAVLATWRSHPAPQGDLADVAEAFARAHAVRREPRPLGAPAIRRIVEAVSSVPPTDAEAETLSRRTDGNPFFVVEYARLARERGGVGEAMGGRPPAAVQDVLRRRVARLPEETRSLLATAAVVGREFDAPLLSAVTRTDETELEDRLDPAIAAGLVRERGAHGFAFAHALVRDSLHDASRASARSRAHALIATELESVRGRETEVARHWLLAGPASAARAWPAARRAAAVTRAVHAHAETAALLRSGLTAMDQDPAAGDADRHTLLMELADADRWVGDWEGLVATTVQAIEVAERIGDAELLARTASATSEGALWQSAPLGHANLEVVEGLRRALALLPVGDGPARCRAMVALAHETYYVSPLAERLALAEDGLAMARRIGEPDLLVDCLQLAAGAVFAPSTAPRRRAWMLEAAPLTLRPGRERAAVVVATQHAVAAGELGLVTEMREVMVQARAEARRLRIHYGLSVLAGLELPWAAMRGDVERSEELLAEVVSLVSLTRTPQAQEAVFGGMLALALWSGTAADVVDDFVGFAGSTAIPIGSAVAFFVLRAGQPDRARELLQRWPIDLDADEANGENWYSLLNRGYAAEVALGLGDADLAATAYRLLLPYEGRSCSAGSANACGPVDAFLALAAAASGDHALAAQHADAAMALVRDWDIPLVGRWLLDQRDRAGF